MKPVLRGPSFLWVWLVAGMVTLVVTTANGCFKAEDTFVNYERTSTVSTGGMGGMGGGTTGDLSARDFFEQNVKDQLIAHCSGSDCHSSGVRAFILIGQEYASITTYVTQVGIPLVIDPPQSSQLLTYPPNPDHSGKSWDNIEEVRDLVLEWLTLEAVDIEPIELNQLGPVTPEGLTVLPMDSLSPDFAGFTMSFYAIVYDDTVLELTDINVWPPNDRGIKIVDPTWIVIPPSGGGEAFTDNSHHGDHVFVAPNEVELASGDLLVTDWGPGYRLAIRFEDLQLLFADDEGNTFVPCTEPSLFADAVEALPVMSQPNQPNGLLYCADQCHGGTKGGQPTNLMSLTGLLEDPRDYPLACAKVRANIVPTQVDESRIITLTQPGGMNGHTPIFSFSGNSGAHNAFRTAMTEWITKEGSSSEE